MSGGECFNDVLPNALWLARNVHISVGANSEDPYSHVVINGDLHLCETEAVAIAILDSRSAPLTELYVYCAETKTLVIDGVGTVTGVEDCRYHIWEILSEKTTVPKNYGQAISRTGDPI